MKLAVARVGTLLLVACSDASVGDEGGDGVGAGLGEFVAINVVVQDGQSQSPDPAYCALWRETHGHVGVYTLSSPAGRADPDPTRAFRAS